MYACIDVCMYILVYESLPESVQTNLSKSPRNPQVICPATWSLFPWRSLTSLWWDLQFKVVSEPPEASVEVLRKFPLVRVYYYLSQGALPKPIYELFQESVYVEAWSRTCLGIFQELVHEIVWWRNWNPITTLGNKSDLLVCISHTKTYLMNFSSLQLKLNLRKVQYFSRVKLSVYYARKCIVARWGVQIFSRRFLPSLLVTETQSSSLSR